MAWSTAEEVRSEAEVVVGSTRVAGATMTPSLSSSSAETWGVISGGVPSLKATELVECLLHHVFEALELVC